MDTLFTIVDKILVVFVIVWIFLSVLNLGACISGLAEATVLANKRTQNPWGIFSYLRRYLTRFFVITFFLIITPISWVVGSYYVTRDSWPPKWLVRLLL